MGKSILVVNMRGMVNSSAGIRKTLSNLNIEKRFNATIVPDTPTYRGMLQKAKDHISWCETTPLLTKKLLESRGRTEGWRPLRPEDLKILGLQDLGGLAENLSESKIILSDLKTVKHYFTLAPPRGGFKRSTRRNYNQGGVLGKNPDLPKIVEKML